MITVQDADLFNCYFQILVMSELQVSVSAARPAVRNREVGSSMPMRQHCATRSCVGVWETRAGLKFVHVDMKKYVGRFLVILFMDNALTQPEINEWMDFSNNLEQFR